MRHRFILYIILQQMSIFDIYLATKRKLAQICWVLMRHSPKFALKALLKLSLGALNQNIHTVLSSSSDNNRPITEICQKLGGAKNVFPKNWLFDIAKIHYHPTILSSLTNLTKWVQVRYHLLL